MTLEEMTLQPTLYQPALNATALEALNMSTERPQRAKQQETPHYTQTPKLLKIRFF
jgi:hypothetical protein